MEEILKKSKSTMMVEVLQKKRSKGGAYPVLEEVLRRSFSSGEGNPEENVL